MLLRAVLKKNIKMWEESLPHVEFAYNRVVHSTTKFSPFQIVYGFNPAAPIDLLPLPMQERINLDASKRADLIKKIHEQARTNIEKMTKTYEKQANKGRKKIVLEPGQLVWIHLRKERFPELRRSKLQPRADGPFKVLRRVNDNAYEIDLPSNYGVSTTFNVADLSPLSGIDESRTTPFQEGEDDEDIPDTVPNHGPAQRSQTQDTPIQGAITRSRAKKLQEEVNSLLTNIDYSTNENFIQPKCSTYVLLRFTHMGDTAGPKETSYTKDGMRYTEAEPSH
jgi:hypothetical protein